VVAAGAVVLLMALMMAGYIGWARHDQALRREASAKVIKYMPLNLEALESRELLSGVTSHGGPNGVLPAAHIININAAPVNDTTAAQSPAIYNPGLQQYGAGIAGLAASYTAAHIPGSIITTDQIFASLTTFVNAHPPTTGQELYIWYLEPGQSLTSLGSAGWHSAIWYNSKPVAVAVVAGQYTYTETHEIVEAATDFVPGKGWFGVDGSHEIADSGFSTEINGIQVADPDNIDGSLMTLGGRTPVKPQPPPPPVPTPLQQLLAPWNALVTAFWARVAAYERLFFTLEQTILTWELSILAGK
jgi:hypothetical protein